MAASRQHFKAEMTARELEALGYRAVVISDSHWNSMALATPQDKTRYVSKWHQVPVPLETNYYRSSLQLHF